MKENKIVSFITLIIAYSYILSVPGHAQEFPSEIWHVGKAVLTSGDTIKGNIRYDIENDLIRVGVDNTVETYSARKILHFTIYDETIKNERYFYALPYRVIENYQTPIIFELLVQGPLTLLCREFIAQETNPVNVYYYGPYYSIRSVLSYDFYFLPHDGEVVRFNQKKNDLLRIMKDKQTEIKQYMKMNDLKPDRLQDIILITTYYNLLVSKE